MDEATYVGADALSPGISPEVADAAARDCSQARRDGETGGPVGSRVKYWRGSHDRTRIRTMSQTMTVTDAKARLSELVAMVERTQEHIDITRNGEPAAVLVSHAELDALRETIAILSDAALVENIRQAEADIAAGNTVNAEDLRDAMQTRRPASA